MLQLAAFGAALLGGAIIAESGRNALALNLSGLIAIPWNYVGDGYAHIARPPYFLWHLDLQPWTITATEPGRGGLPAGALSYLRAVPEGQPRSMLPWKIYEDDSPYATNSQACALYHCVADNIISDLGLYFEFGCGGTRNWTFSGAWWEHGVNSTAQQTRRAFETINDAGLQVDLWISDTEKGMSSWTIGGTDACAAMRWRAIEADPRWPSLYAELKSFGFEGPDAPPHSGNILFETVGNWRSSKNYLVWNAVMLRRVQEYYNKAMWWPAANLFPKLFGSDYKGYYWDPVRFVPDMNGHRVTDYGRGAHFGTHQSASFYGSFKQLALLSDVVVPGRYASTPFNAFRYDLQQHRSQILANPAVPTAPWICKRSWQGDDLYSRIITDSPYWEESIIHMILSGAKLFIYWNHPASDLEAEAAVLDNLLSSVTEIMAKHLSHNIRQAIGPWQPEFNSLASWSTPWVYTGLKSTTDPARCLWRLTVDAEITSGQAVLLQANPALFQIDKSVLDFGPDASVLNTTMPSNNAGVGWFVFQSRCTEPVRTTCIHSFGTASKTFAVSPGESTTSLSETPAAQISTALKETPSELSTNKIIDPLLAPSVQPVRQCLVIPSTTITTTAQKAKRKRKRETRPAHKRIRKRRMRYGWKRNQRSTRRKKRKGK